MSTLFSTEAVSENTASNQHRSVSGISSRFARFRPTAVFDTYWKFATERQAIFFRRVKGITRPWTADPILSYHKFTNVYRASDRVSQYLIRNVLYKGDQSWREVFYRVLLFKLFNKIETWELLTHSLREPLTTATPLKAISDILSEARLSGLKIYSGAYIMPSGTGPFRATKKHESHLRILKHLLDQSVPERLADCHTMQSAFLLLRAFPMMGDFLAYQYLIDLNYGATLNFSESEFVVPGPGAKSGLRKCFQAFDGMTESDLIKMVADEQELEFASRGLSFQYLPGRALQYIDCQNLFCEIDKYSRIAHPEISGHYGRKRIKQLFRPHTTVPIPWYPPKWGTNQLMSVSADLFRENHARAS
jgi:hypothetical protein